jgi:hypothetical protein
MENLNVFKSRLKKIGINIDFVGNYPWIYINSINGLLVNEKYMAEHGFTVGIITVNGDFKFTEFKIIFSLIRKYIHER